MYYPIMAALISKKKGNKLYYYVVESARVEGKPRIVQQTYLGTADRLADLLKERTAPVPLSATTREFGLPAALWLAAQRSGVWDVLKAISLVGRHPPHLSAWARDRGCRLVSVHDLAAAVVPFSRTVSLPGFLGRL